MAEIIARNEQLVVPTARLRTTCDAIATRRAEVADVAHVGQRRAVESARFGIGVEREGFNLFVMGPPGSHRHALVTELAEARAARKPSPEDWCYANNFANPERPRALRLPAGRGAAFREDMHALIDEIRIAIPAAFEEEDYRNQLKALESELHEEIEQQWEDIRRKAAKDDIAVLQTPSGYVLAPLRDGKVIDDKDFKELPDDERKSIEATIDKLGEELQARIESLPKLRKQQHERVRALDREVTAHAVTVLIQELAAKYADVPDVAHYLEEAREDIIEHAQEFRQTDEPALPFLRNDIPSLLMSYEINLVVGNEPDRPAPVIYETNPSYPNLVGKVEHRAEMGALLTDFRMVRGGALLHANGGYLVLDAHRVLGRPFAWEALKQALFTKEVRIESPADTLGFATTTTLKPEPIPLDVKIILIGERWLYYLLSLYDKEFGSLFKVAVDLDDDVERTGDSVAAYAKMIGNRVRSHELLPFDEAAVRRVIEQRARQADDSERLSMNMQSLDDLLVEAEYWARQHDANSVGVDDVVEAIRRKKERLGRIEKRIVDAIERDTLLIDTSGECVGQINGLSVIDLGDHRFGHPVRITATTRIGTGDVVDIEREVELGGAIHSKGVMILSSALSSRYAPDTPLSLHGSIVFEQSYGGVDGDSASVAELCALLSSISKLPIRQNVACTGSINQLGRVQAVGGVNEKIEGFYEICKARGLDGTHGVVIPKDNVKHLMLREDVVDAVDKGRFAVWAVETIDEAVETLTGTRADVVSGKVEEQLVEYARQRKRFAEGTSNGASNNE
ncbi:MAG: AAA family ATPase [Woeseiaceae bacterium]|nr:AAA family ATPase [Gammaproteobacteria bacterium]NNF50522.1 AAA family ATPase [Woeseiaceae bacterium]NNK24440.1 AAA family ATPase [Woeseiaceae bacterium]